ncbi:DUF3857 domain-containing protein [Flavobacterium sp.]|uniref:DUF3857 domain-containing protein n=1 Tax=Flavobacterium sp. TaxID=239 RepID=UPI00286E4647|nr:DUF3857 domain-containing protein [Flavobacterium sp.]
MKTLISLVVIILFSTSIYAQKLEYSTLFIPDSLKQNANTVVRLDQMDIVIASQRSMNVKQKRVVTVLNEKGQNAINAYENYDKKTTVKEIHATIYDALGNEIKKAKRKDFRDQCMLDGITIFSDSRFIYLEYTPTQYPFTIVYESEVETSNTAFIPQWIPLNENFVSIEKCVLNVNFPSNLGFKKKEFNFTDFKIKKTADTATNLSYIATNLLAQKEEDYSPVYVGFPRLMLGLEVFNIEGVDGNAKTWKEFGQWYSDKILTGTTELSDETKIKIKALVGNETDPIKKAKIIYHYVQEKSRYVSIQVGIGGWKPMYANDVDRLGYGDCKALTNYTKALLNVVDVPTYNTILYGGREKIDIESDFVSMQGNHMILTIPDGEKYIWLECTSQDDPFGYQANFTDDRNVLVIKPDGAEIVRTKNYQDKDNTQVNTGKYTLSEDGTFTGTITMVSQGSQYGSKVRVEKLQPTDKEAHYKNYWDNISNLKLNKITFSNDKQKISFAENLDISAENYGKITSNTMIFVVNAFSQETGSIKRIRNRKNPFEITRGSYDSDEITIALPSGFAIESIPQKTELTSKFVEYKTEVIKSDSSNLVYKRTFFVKKGLYTSKEYDEFRLFMEQVSRNDNAKIILTKIQ